MGGIASLRVQRYGFFVDQTNFLYKFLVFSIEAGCFFLYMEKQEKRARLLYDAPSFR